jgi:hydrogenase/urease accessory protein HupE
MLFSVGMIAASAALHAAGLGIGSACITASRASWLRFAGAATAVAALGMFVL